MAMGLEPALGGAVRNCLRCLRQPPATLIVSFTHQHITRSFSSSTHGNQIQNSSSAPRRPKVPLLSKCANAFRSAHSFADLKPKTVDPKQQQRLYELSLALSRTPMNGNAEVQCIFYDSSGAASGTKKLSKSQIAEQYGLSTRDLRTIDLPSAGFPHILIRDCSILVHIFDLRLLIQADKVVLFDVDEDVGREHYDNTSRIFSHNLEDKLHHTHGVGGASKMPYELRVLETALTSVTSTLEAQYLMNKKEVKETLETLNEDSVIHSKLRNLLELVRRLASVEQRATLVRDAVQEVMNEDRDMADMYLTDKRAGAPHTIDDHQSVEYLLEAIHKASDAVVQQTHGLLGDIRRTEDTIQSILNVRRNQIMVLEAKIEILMVGLASATLVAGWYGMNVVNYSEDSSWAFGALTALCLLGTGVIWRMGSRRLRNIQKTRL